jgi:conserved oligomeric Golgi complex subunit 1
VTNAGVRRLTCTERSKLAVASQIATLKNCATVIARMLKRGESTLLAAKILVLARLTHKILTQLEPNSDLIESFKRRLASLHGRIREAVDAQLSDPKAEAGLLVQHLCAFSLTTSATTRDILRHFHDVRLKAIEDCLAGKSASNEEATKAVHLLVGTLHVSQQIFPKRLSEALAKLRQKPLLQHVDVRSVAGLELELHERWIAEELRNYTIWHRQDELQKADTDKELKKWARSAVKSFCTGLRSNLQRLDSFSSIVTLRKDVFKTWPWSGKKLPGLDSAEVADELREILNERLGQLLTSSAAKLRDVLQTASASLESATNENITLWETEFTSKDLANGATGYKTKVKSLHRGEDTASKKSIQSYAKWTEDMSKLAIAINEMRNDRWDDDLDDDDDDMDADSRQILLSSDDPRDLERGFIKALEQSFGSLQKGLEGLVDSLSNDSDDILPKRIAYLRILRELLQRSIGEGFRSQVNLTLKINESKLLKLQESLAAHATSSPTKIYRQNLQKLASRKSLPGMILWQGSPAMPVQPSPSAYRFLQSLSVEMASLGSDLWAAGTVAVLQQQAAKSVTAVLEESCESIKAKQATTTNGDKHEDEDEDEETVKEEESTSTHDKEKLIQLYFDASYIRAALDGNNKAPVLFSDVLQKIAQGANLGKAGALKLESSAFDYWKRTYLIFALLAV